MVPVCYLRAFVFETLVKSMTTKFKEFNERLKWERLLFKRNKQPFSFLPQWYLSQPVTVRFYLLFHVVLPWARWCMYAESQRHPAWPWVFHTCTQAPSVGEDGDIKKSLGWNRDGEAGLAMESLGGGGQNYRWIKSQSARHSLHCCTGLYLKHKDTIFKNARWWLESIKPRAEGLCVRDPVHLHWFHAHKTSSGLGDQRRCPRGYAVWACGRQRWTNLWRPSSGKYKVRSQKSPVWLDHEGWGEMRWKKMTKHHEEAGGGLGTQCFGRSAEN